MNVSIGDSGVVPGLVGPHCPAVVGVGHSVPPKLGANHGGETMVSPPRAQVLGQYFKTMLVSPRRYHADAVCIQASISTTVTAVS